MIKIYETSVDESIYDIMKLNVGKKIIFTNSAHSFLAFVNIQDYTRYKYIWRIDRWGTVPIFEIGVSATTGELRAVSREKFIDHIKNNHSDHFEWFIWNPEWFGSIK